jgi:hypothetical protein
MPKPTPETIAAELAVPERVLLFCLASDTIGRKQESHTPPRKSCL